MNARSYTMIHDDGFEPDAVLLVASAGLLLLGMVMLTSASLSIGESELGQPFFYLGRQSIFLLLGFVAALFFVVVPTIVWERSGLMLMIVALLLLTVVLLPGIGHEVNGSTRWLRLGPIGLQVSEPARLLIIMYLAGYIVRHRAELNERFTGFLKPMLFVALACVMLLAEPDFGAATVLVITALGLLFVGGVRIRDFAVLLVPVVSGLAALAISSPYRMRRLTGFLNPWGDPYDSGFQLTQSLIAFGRGEWFGVGLGNSVQKLFYLPEAHTDFVFAVLAEELGFVGAAFTIVLFAVLVWRALCLGRRAAFAGCDFQAFLATGIGIWLGMQAAINIGVNMGLLPTKGLTLPMLSYGGSSLLVTCACIGVLLRIDYEVSQFCHPAARKIRHPS